MMAQMLPNLNIKEIQDIYIRNNFQNLEQYFTNQNQMLNFKFFEIIFTKASSNYKLGHQLNALPQDILLTQLTGPGSVSFNIGLSDIINLDISVTDACRIRFFVGNFWNFSSTIQQAKSDVINFEQMASSSMPTISQKIVKANYQITIQDKLILVDCTNGPVVLILPGADNADQLNIRVQKIDTTSNIVTIKTSISSEQIRSSNATVNLTSQWSAQIFYCIKPNWYY